MESIVVSNNNPYFRTHNVRVEADELLRAEANVLYPPAITYSQDGRDRDDVQNGVLNWGKLGQRRFLMPCLRQDSHPLVWVASIVNNGVPGRDCEQFLKVGARVELLGL